MKFGHWLGKSKCQNQKPTRSQRLIATAPNLAKVGVEGSNPFARSNFINDII
jgi:hypothetical protein